MQLPKLFLLTVVCLTKGCSTEHLAATFFAVPAVGACPSRTAALTARSRLECAQKCSLTDACLSFSFINGICVHSENLRSATNIAASVFRKLVNASTYLGYLQLIGARRFWVFQQRKTGAVSFARNWADYEQGFGDGTEFWSGLQSLNSLTLSANANLRIEMTALDGNQFVAEWSNFTVCDASTNYTMQYRNYLNASSNISVDALEMHNGMQFSTFDRDNDRHDMSCSASFGNAGFWFNNCLRISPNGFYSTTNMWKAAYMSCRYIYPNAIYSTLRAMRMMLELQ